MKSGQRKKTARWREILPLLLILPIILPTILLIGILYAISTVYIYAMAWLWWAPRGIHLLYVYSDSPHWKDYIEQTILPRLPEGQVILNWSARKQWSKWALSSWMFHYFSTFREYAPMAILIRPFRRAKIFRFYKPFKDFQHGHPESLHAMEAAFFETLDPTR